MHWMGMHCSRLVEQHRTRVSVWHMHNCMVCFTKTASVSLSFDGRHTITCLVSCAACAICSRTGSWLRAPGPHIQLQPTVFALPPA